jgi:predicted permease
VTTTDLGLDTEHAWVVSLRSSGSGRSPRELAVFFEQALERVRAVPGVRSASLATHAPLRGATGLLLRTRRDGEWVQATHGSPLGSQVADGYFDALGLRLAAGRGFTAADRTSSTVVVVNEALARLAWPGRSPVGACAFLSSSPETCARVVGVARNAHTFRIREEQQLAVYVPLPPAEPGDRVLLVRETPGIRGLDGTLRHVLRELDPALPYLDVQRLGDALVPEIRPWRLGATVFTVFGVLAALLAALGLYTAMAYAVTQRTREIGVRVALGAQAHGILRLVLGDALRLAGAGILTGLVVAIGVAGGIADLLFETSPRDPAVFATVGFTLLGVALAACVAPARRAARVSPTEALRAD